MADESVEVEQAVDASVEVATLQSAMSWGDNDEDDELPELPAGYEEEQAGAI
jgi:hypothetical protein